MSSRCLTILSGNIEGNVSLFEEYFEQQECELNFIPIQIIGVYVNGIKLLKSEYEIILPKKIKIKEYVDENIQVQYTKLINSKPNELPPFFFNFR